MKNPIAIDLPTGWLNTETGGFEELQTRSHDSFAFAMFEANAGKKAMEEVRRTAGSRTDYRALYDAAYGWMLDHGWVRIATEGMLAGSKSSLREVKDFVLFHMPMGQEERLAVYIDLFTGTKMFTGYLMAVDFFDADSWTAISRQLQEAAWEEIG